ncbi:hypothetical protein OsI_36326 [Oryza sativa Indica Group]|uniref:Uncharacterized protein n=1 Tax=Oryza sativa subsp. indica TaxID=39946 RepID=A2ZEW0_ORYSI|nr:hypothetical protein OsI_36326 [Oryza sativa Indica Group]
MEFRNHADHAEKLYEVKIAFPFSSLPLLSLTPRIPHGVGCDHDSLLSRAVEFRNHAEKLYELFLVDVRFLPFRCHVRDVTEEEPHEEEVFVGGGEGASDSTD